MFRKPASSLIVLSLLLLCGCKTISGVVTLINGGGLAGVTVTLEGSTTLNTVTDSKGSFSFDANSLSNGSYTVTPALGGISFTPSSQILNYAGATITGVDFDAGIIGFLDRRYNEVSFPTTHNAMSNQEDGWLLPNQRYSIPNQLADGVRGLMLDIWEWEGEIILCHGCDEWYGYLGGHKPLLDGLLEIKQFLDDNPEEIVTIIFESYVSMSDAENVFIQAGLLGYTHTQTLGDPWPTLNDMIAAGDRLMVLTDHDGSLGTWYHPVWSFAWETHWSNEYPEDFSCADNRGSPSNDLFILNHFLTRGATPKSILAQEVNHNPLFVDRTLECWNDSGKIPNFPSVDFYDIGDLFSVVNTLNTQ